MAVQHCWDEEESRLVAVEARLVPGPGGRADLRSQIAVSPPASSQQEPPPPALIVSFFVLEEEGIVLHDSSPVASQFVKLLALDLPHFHLLTNPREADQTAVETRMLRDFSGLEMTDKKTKDAIVNFSMHLCIGNMDEAFKAIKMIKSEQVWENMARMCVKTRRLDVAAICLGNMGHAAGARAVREAIRDKEEPGVQAAILAVHLGMLTEAEQLLAESGRWDLLNRLYQDSGQWEKALEVCNRGHKILGKMSRG